ncbi:MAG: hypothetical protein WCI75_19950, partial [candidate division NC10 bacterium]
MVTFVATTPRDGPESAGAFGSCWGATRRIPSSAFGDSPVRRADAPPVFRFGDARQSEHPASRFLILIDAQATFGGKSCADPQNSTPYGAGIRRNKEEIMRRGGWVML